MVVSTEKPKQIYIFNIKDDIKRGKTLVKYAFRYNIESTVMEHEIEEGQIEEVQAWQYEEYISEQEFDLFFERRYTGYTSKHVYRNSTKVGGNAKLYRDRIAERV